MLPIFLARARRLGIVVDDLIERYRIEPADGDVGITCAALRAVGDAIAERARDPKFGCNTALEMPRGSYGLIEYVVRTTPTLRALIGQLVRFSRLINAQLVATFDERTGKLEQHILGEPHGMGAQGNEFSLVHQTQIVRDACATRVVVERVYFAHPAPSTRDPDIAEYFGTQDVVYGAGFNGVVLSQRALDTPLVSADLPLFRILEDRASALVAELSAGRGLEDVQRAIVRALETGDASARRVARALATSERTLHRRSAAQGTTYGALVDELRHKLALEYLADPSRSVSEVALLVGYSDGRAFARAFRRWTSTTPVEWRKAR